MARVQACTGVQACNIACSNVANARSKHGQNTAAFTAHICTVDGITGCHITLHICGVRKHATASEVAITIHVQIVCEKEQKEAEGGGGNAEEEEQEDFCMLSQTSD